MKKSKKKSHKGLILFKKAKMHPWKDCGIVPYPEELSLVDFTHHDNEICEQLLAARYGWA